MIITFPLSYHSDSVEVEPVQGCASVVPLMALVPVVTKDELLSLLSPAH